MLSYDAIVLGAGAMGSAAAYHLTKAGARVLLLEQYEIDHNRGSSYGPSRIIRYAYDHPTYITLAKAAYPLWFALEAETGQTFYTRTGGLDFGMPDAETMVNTRRSLQSANIPCELLAPDEAQRRFPQFRFDPQYQIIYQPDTGSLLASDCVKAHVRLAEQRGAHILANTPVNHIIAHQRSVEVITADKTYSAAKLVITAGSWGQTLLAQLDLNLPLTPTRCQIAYFRGENPSHYQPDRFPPFIAHIKDDRGFFAYGLPSFQNSGLKVGFHGGQPHAHPSEIDYTPNTNEIERIQTFCQQHLPGAATGLLSSLVCLYTMTPDEHFIIDAHPQHPHIVFGAGFSGHGFKFSALIGSILCDLALHGRTEYDISLFQVSRFNLGENSQH